MNRIQYMGDSPVFIDDFKKGCERSCKGSLHLFPKRLIRVTDGELEHLKDSRKDVFKDLRVYPKEVPKDEAKPKQSAEAENSESSPKSEEKSEPSAPKEEEEKKPKSSERKKKKTKSSSELL